MYADLTLPVSASGARQFSTDRAVVSPEGEAHICTRGLTDFLLARRTTTRHYYRPTLALRYIHTRSCLRFSINHRSGRLRVSLDLALGRSPTQHTEATLVEQIDHACW